MHYGDNPTDHMHQFVLNNGLWLRPQHCRRRAWLIGRTPSSTQTTHVTDEIDVVSAKSLGFSFSHLVHCGDILPVCTSRFHGTDGSIFHERLPEVRLEVRHEPPITGTFKFRSPSRRRTTNVYNSTLRVHFAIQSKTDQQ